MERTLQVASQEYRIHALDQLGLGGDVATLPFSLKVLLENLARHADGVSVTDEDLAALTAWDPRPDGGDGGSHRREVPFTPSRILLQDFTGVPAVVDLAAMRDAVETLGGESAGIDPLVPVELVIDHSIIADVAGTADAFSRNGELEHQRNAERYQFLRWGQGAFAGLTVVPPNTGICHQVNLEHLARVVFVDGEGRAYPDTLVGTDSHTPMVNGLGVLGWGVGGIEAEAAMLGQPISMLTPTVVGFELGGELPEGATATDLVLTVTEMLRHHGVVGKFVEFFGPGVSSITIENRATIGNMSPEYGATCAIFPIDGETLRYLRFTGRRPEQVALVEAYAKEQGLWHDPSVTPRYSEHLRLDLGTVVPSLAGPSRPQDRVPLDRAKAMFHQALGDYLAAQDDRGGGLPLHVRNASPEDASVESFPASDPPAAMAGMTDSRRSGLSSPAADASRRSGLSSPAADASRRSGLSSPAAGGDDERLDEPGPVAPAPDEPSSTGVEVRTAAGETFALDHGSVVIAAITSCTNTSNPSVMVAAGLLAKHARERGLRTRPWVKTSLAPGSKVVTDYYERAGLTRYLDELGFQLVGYGCTTCIGNSGPLAPEISQAIDAGHLSVAAVLSGNRNFEGRIHPEVRMNYLASPPLVVAYALAGTMDVDLLTDPLGTGSGGEPVHLRDLWPTQAEVNDVVATSLQSDMFTKRYESVLEGDERWRSLPVPTGERYEWDRTSTYVQRPPFFDGMSTEPSPPADIEGARVLALLGDSVTTDHISPAGSIRPDSPAGLWLQEHGVEPSDFNSYGSRRGNHEIMLRGTFANIRLRNHLVAGVEGGFTRHLPDGEQMAIYDAAMRYQAEGVPLVVIAGREYGAGSSRDWAAKGTALLGVRAVLAESFERIHRSNLIGMGVLPIEFPEDGGAAALGLTGHETVTIRGLAGRDERALIGARLRVEAGGAAFDARARIDTPMEAAYFHHGGILRYVIRQLAARAS